MSMQDAPLMGIFVVDKPQGFTSFDVVAKMRGICATRKIGHGGTLDPMATGVLPVFVGGAAKAVDLAPRQDKVYEATVRFGVGTDTGDIMGTVLKTSDAVAGTDDVLPLLPQFLGEQEQLPPLYSAVKVNGKPMYKYAREGKEVARKPRRITVHALDYLGHAGANDHVLRVHCSKGTYIRTLAEDLGAALGMPATLAALRRTAAGVFTQEQAHSLQAVQQAKDAGCLRELMCPVEVLFAGMPRHDVDEAAMRRLMNGVALRQVQAAPGRYALYCRGAFMGLGAVGDTAVLKAEKLFFRLED